MNNIALQYYDESKNIWGLPQQYKDLLLYPIMIADTKYWNLFFKLLTYPKNFIAEKQIIKMSYLKFVMYALPNENSARSIRDDFIDFIKYITKENDVYITEIIKEKPITSYSSFDIKVIINDRVFTENDLDNIREIILEQNGLGIEYVEKYSPELEKSLIYANKRNSVNEEDQITIFSVLSGQSIDEIKKYTVYQFSKLFERFLLLEDFRLYQPLLTSGQIELKNGKIQHYSVHVGKKGRYDSILVDVDEFEDKHKGLIPPRKRKIRS
jgi:hypothetical protein